MLHIPRPPILIALLWLLPLSSARADTAPHWVRRAADEADKIQRVSDRLTLLETIGHAQLSIRDRDGLAATIPRYERALKSLDHDLHCSRRATLAVWRHATGDEPAARRLLEQCVNEIDAAAKADPDADETDAFNPFRWTSIADACARIGDVAAVRRIADRCKDENDRAAFLIDAATSIELIEWAPAPEIPPELLTLIAEAIERVKDPSARSRLYGELASIHLARNDTGEARRLLDERITLPGHRAAILQGFALHHARQAKWDDYRAAVREVRDIAGAAGSTRAKIDRLLALAHLQTAANDRDGALETLRHLEPLLPPPTPPPRDGGNDDDDDDDDEPEDEEHVPAEDGLTRDTVIQLHVEYTTALAEAGNPAAARRKLDVLVAAVGADALRTGPQQHYLTDLVRAFALQRDDATVRLVIDTIDRPDKRADHAMQRLIACAHTDRLPDARNLLPLVPPYSRGLAHFIIARQETSTARLPDAQRRLQSSPDPLARAQTALGIAKGLLDLQTRDAPQQP